MTHSMAWGLEYGGEWGKGQANGFGRMKKSRASPAKQLGQDNATTLEEGCDRATCGEWRTSSCSREGSLGWGSERTGFPRPAGREGET